MEQKTIDNLLAFDKAVDNSKEEVNNLFSTTHEVIKRILPLYNGIFSAEIGYDEGKMFDLDSEDKIYKLNIKENNSGEIQVTLKKGYKSKLKFNFVNNDDNLFNEISKLYVSNGPSKDELSDIGIQFFLSDEQINSKNQMKFRQNYDKFSNGVVTSRIEQKPNNFSYTYDFLNALNNYLTEKIDKLKEYHATHNTKT
ncbi:MAG: hypothetical protein ACMXX8_04070 [Candidatus Woesearchaeota archaeon]